jgi:hypothetical protein
LSRIAAPAGAARLPALAAALIAALSLAVFRTSYSV